MNRWKQVLSIFLLCCISLTTFPGELAYAADEPTTPTPIVSAQPTAQELQQLVAPISLYPDSLVAQILAASTYPEQVVEADRWVQENPQLKGDQLAQAVDKQNWDPGVKAMMAFPSVLANMDKNLSWTTSLGDAYINNQQGVMNAVQSMRQSAKKAGHLNSTSQLNVSEQGQTIVIEPANPQVVYVPEYNPWAVYGLPVAPWPGWYMYPGLYWTSPGIAFGIGFGIGFFGGFAWGFHSWGPDWGHGSIMFNHGYYMSHGRMAMNRGYYAHGGAGGFHGGGFHGGDGLHGGNGFHGGATSQHGFAAPSGGHNSAFGGFGHGGTVGGYSARGYSSLGGSHGGGFHGGGSHGGGHR
jgi:hypothetical protein